MAAALVNLDNVSSLQDLPKQASTAPNGYYVVRNTKSYDDPDQVESTDGGYQFETWFKTPAFTPDTIKRINSVQLFAESHDQGDADDQTSGNWTWFELAIMENEGSEKPWTKDDIVLTWESHKNNFMTSEFKWKEGKKFDAQADIFRLLQDGNVIAVRLCTRFPGWAMYARKGYLVIELGHPATREPLEYGSVATKTKAFQDVIDNLNEELFPNREKPTAPKLAFRAQEALGTIDDAPLRVLSLDGGGVRGLASLTILKNIMDKLHPGKKPCEVFDMIAGTSTGGFIAIMLGRLGMTVDECIKEYTAVMDDVFPPQSSFRNGWNMVAHAGKWDDAVLEKVIKRLVEKRLKGQDGNTVTLMDPKDPNPRCKVFVMATKSNGSNNSGPAVFRSYVNPVEPRSYENIKLWQAARATSAAPTYFKPMTIGTETFVDGGLQANNPLGWLWYEVLGTFGLARAAACFLSIGTGTPPKAALPSNFALHPIDTPMAIAGVATNSEIPNILFRTLINAFAPQAGKKKYYRFNVGDGLPDWVETEKGMWKWVLLGTRKEEDIGNLDDVGKIKLTIKRAEEYVNEKQAQKMVNECVDCLR